MRINGTFQVSFIRFLFRNFSFFSPYTKEVLTLNKIKIYRGVVLPKSKSKRILNRKTAILRMDFSSYICRLNLVHRQCCGELLKI